MVKKQKSKNQGERIFKRIIAGSVVIIDSSPDSLNNHRATFSGLMLDTAHSQSAARWS